MTQDYERGFISSLAAEGLTHEQIAAQLVSLGWHPQSAIGALRRFADRAPAPEEKPKSPGPDLSQVPPWIDLGDRRTNILMFTRAPKACLFGGFLSETECEELISLSKPHMARSRVISSDELDDDEGALAYARTSEQTSFSKGESVLVDAICKRVSIATRWAEDHMEGLQVVRYGPGAEFTPHHDYFCPDAHAELIARSGQRVGTILLYLTTPEFGGSTIFTDTELEVLPQQGNALFFAYPNADPGSLTLHAGVPVASGEKWIATVFLRDRALPSSLAAMRTERN